MGGGIMKIFTIWFLVVFAAAGLSSCGSGNASEKTRQVIFTADAPAPVGAYSQGILFGDVLSLSGQVGIDPATGNLVEGGVVSEAEQALKNLGAILRAAGMGYEDAVMATVFLTSIDDYAAVNALYATYFTTDPPARQVVAVDALPKGASVEISLVAMKGSIL